MVSHYRIFREANSISSFRYGAGDYREFCARSRASLGQSALRTGNTFFKSRCKRWAAVQKSQTHRQDRNSEVVSWKLKPNLCSHRLDVRWKLSLYKLRLLWDTTALLFYTNDGEHMRVTPAHFEHGGGGQRGRAVREVTQNNKLGFRATPFKCKVCVPVLLNSFYYYDVSRI